jgi:SP family arabinose:H+ symporter-like MFS transporter
MPNSPRWLILKKRDEEATATLRYLLGKVDVSVELTRDSRFSVSRKSSSVLDLFKKPSIATTRSSVWRYSCFNSLRVLMRLFTTVLVFLRELDLVMIRSLLRKWRLAFINMVSTIFGVWVVDRWGRRSLLFTGMVGMASCLCSS